MWRRILAVEEEAYSYSGVRQRSGPRGGGRLRLQVQWRCNVVDGVYTCCSSERGEEIQGKVPATWKKCGGAHNTVSCGLTLNKIFGSRLVGHPGGGKEFVTVLCCSGSTPTAAPYQSCVPGMGLW